MKKELVYKSDVAHALMQWMDEHKREHLHKQDIAEVIMNMPSAEKKGKWIKKSNTNPYWTEWWYECSECCHTPLHDRYRQEALTDFCPNCGARMEYEEE